MILLALNYLLHFGDDLFGCGASWYFHVEMFWLHEISMQDYTHALKFLTPKISSN